MSREIRTIKDDKDNELEVYVDFCNLCTKEMLTPKNMADFLESTFPFIKKKLEEGSPCIECAQELAKQDNNFKILSESEIEIIKNKAMSFSNDQSE